MATRAADTMEKTTVWTLDPAHSKIQFSARHMVITEVTGHFGKYEVKVKTHGDDFETADVEVKIDAKSLDTGIPDRDNHLRSADFFETEKFGDITFKSTSVKKIDDESYKLYGDLTIRDVTKPIELDVEYGGQIVDPWGNERVGFTLKGSLNRFDYGLKWNALIETGGAVVSKKINLSANIELVKQK